MHEHQLLLIELIKKEREASPSGADLYTARQMSVRSGVNESSLSRFLNGKQDLRAGDFFALLGSFPEDFQERFWTRFRSTKSDWRSLIMSASPEDFEEICTAMAEWWASRSRKSPSRSRKFTDPNKAELVL